MKANKRNLNIIYIFRTHNRYVIAPTLFTSLFFFFFFCSMFTQYVLFFIHSFAFDLSIDESLYTLLQNNSIIIIQHFIVERSPTSSVRTHTHTHQIHSKCLFSSSNIQFFAFYFLSSEFIRFFYDKKWCWLRSIEMYHVCHIQTEMNLLSQFN